MRINLEIDAKALMERFSLTEKNLAFAAVNAINKTAKDLQLAEQQNVRSKFTVRKSEFMMRQAAVIKPFASVSQSRPFAEVAVGQKDRLLLSTFERGGTKTPFVGKNVAVPITGSPARPGFSAPVAGNLMITALGMKPELSAVAKLQRRSLKGGTRKETASMRKDFTRAAAFEQPWQGRERTYLIPGIGIFQRNGKEKKATTLLYKFVPRPQLKPTLGFVALADTDGQRMLNLNMEAAIETEVVRSFARNR